MTLAKVLNLNHIVIAVVKPIYSEIGRRAEA
jgi:hypothetical protein